MSATILSILAWTVAAPAAPPAAYCIELEVEHVRNAEGQLWVAVFADEEAYETNGDTAILTQVPAAKGTVAVELCGLAAGRYAISVFHDENASGDLDTTRIGIPREGYGFSRNVRGVAGLPAFDRVAIELSGDAPRRAETIRLQYLL